MQPSTLVNDLLVSPINCGYDGGVKLKPWFYRVTAVIPHCDTLETLPVLLQLLRLQSEKPYIIIVDTGTPIGKLDELEKFRSEDCEIHYVRAHAYFHRSQPVCVAQDLGWALCRTQYCFTTHTDCFPMRIDLLEWLLNQCDAATPVVGYRMSNREWATDDWVLMPSHTCSMYFMPEMRRIGANWNIVSASERIGYENMRDGWPDTETALGYCLLDNEIKVKFIGNETNFERHVDENIDHFRSYSGSKIYAPNYYKAATVWFNDAMSKAKERIEQWTN